MKKLAVILSLIVFCSYPSASNAATGVLYSKVKQVLVSAPPLFGSCLVLLEDQISSVGLECTGGWLSFSCTGDFQPKDVAYKMLDMVYLSIVLDQELRFVANDTKKHNGYCVAERVDLIVQIP
jgi:hypothetical protein